MDNATKACLDEAAAIVAADKPAGPGSESYDPTKLLQLALRWSEEHRFPRECYATISADLLVVDILRVLALFSPSFAACPSVPQDLLKIAGWDVSGTVPKARATNTLLALRALANMFSTAAGQATMVTAAEQGFFPELVKGRPWADLGNAKQAYATIALK